jgi:lipoate-protein ligase A
MKFFDLGTIPWKQTQLIYHALGNLGIESIVLCSPEENYACVGFHQSINYELDLDYCMKNGIGVFRREIGGGSVFLDENQIFYQIIIHRDNAPLDQKRIFEKFLKPVIKTYQDFGINAEFKPVSDIVVGTKKISGNGGGDIGECKVITGSILLDFDHMTMCRILNLPSKEFRANVCDYMKKNLTTAKIELGYIPDILDIKTHLISNFEDFFGVLEAEKLDSAIQTQMNELEQKFSEPKWLFKKSKAEQFRNIKINEGLNLVYTNLNGFELCLELRAEIIKNVKFYSTFSEELKGNLNNALIGKKFIPDLTLKVLNKHLKKDIN